MHSRHTEHDRVLERVKGGGTVGEITAAPVINTMEYNIKHIRNENGFTTSGNA